MTDDDLVVKFIAVLDEFARGERERALAQAKRQRLVVTHPIADGQMQFETLVDEGASAAEIFEVLAPLEGAIDRLKAQAELVLHYGAMLNQCGLIEQAVEKLRDDGEKFQRENAQRNAGHRVQRVGLTDAQHAGLDQHRGNIRLGFERIEEARKAAAECLRVLEGESRFSVLDEQIAARLDALRGQRPDAA
jgi:hypothetical protein